jgi:hypothetical protein
VPCYGCACRVRCVLRCAHTSPAALRAAASLLSPCISFFLKHIVGFYARSRADELTCATPCQSLGTGPHHAVISYTARVMLPGRQIARFPVSVPTSGLPLRTVHCAQCRDTCQRVITHDTEHCAAAVIYVSCVNVVSYTCRHVRRCAMRNARCCSFVG